ncbi:MAG: lysophospholipid acyltransferase family protein [Gemmatimonadota bacterium]
MYALLRLLSRTALAWYYRSIEVLDADRVPETGAVILAANHPNALVDALVVGGSTDRRIRMTAKSTVFANPILGSFLRGAGVIPLRRVADEEGAAAADRNREAFRAVTQSLSTGSTVLIFPEGRSHDDAELSGLRTGCARMALSARAEGVNPLVIVPVGLTFEQKDRPRTRVAVRFGHPITVSEASGPLPDAVRSLTATIDRELRSLTLNFTSHEEAARILQISTALSGLVERVAPLDDEHVSLGGTLSVVDRVERALRAAAPEREARVQVDALLDRLFRFRRELEELAVPVTELWVETDLRSGLLFTGRELLLLGISLPAALWGRLNHFLPLRLATRIGKAASSRAEPAMRTIIAGLVFVLLFYASAVLVALYVVGWIGATVYTLSLPAAAFVDFWLTDRWPRVLGRARTWLLFRRRPDLQRRLIGEAATIRSEAERIESAVTAG